tara:strand:+ start:3117 stop:3455 length:339 start_codon:yes stop_codon:yes gene_type:complete
LSNNINNLAFESKVKRLIKENKMYKNVEFMFNKEKAIKRIMQLEGELFIPHHVPQGTPEDPDNPEFREFSQQEKDNCRCHNCKFPVAYWNKKTEREIQRDLSSLEYLKVNAV